MKKKVFMTVAAVAASMVFAAVSAQAVDIKVNGEKIETETPAVIVDERTLVPLRAISECFGMQVDWDGDTRTVSINEK